MYVRQYNEVSAGRGGRTNVKKNIKINKLIIQPTFFLILIVRHFDLQPKFTQGSPTQAGVYEGSRTDL